MNDTEQQINAVCNQIKTLLLLKNKAYGDSALEPVRIFSKNSSIDGLLVRIDDKLSRIKNMGVSSASEDTLMDLIGYLVLLKIQLNKSMSSGFEAMAKETQKKIVDQLGLPKMPPTYWQGTHHDIDKIRYTNGTMTGY
jgi:hypothetical protein